MRKQNMKVKAEIVKSVPVEIPLYLMYYSGEDEENIVFGEDYSEYWKIESNWKITIIKEDSDSVTVITYRDENFDAFYEHVEQSMLNEENGWSITEERIYDAAFNRLIDKVTTA